MRQVVVGEHQNDAQGNPAGGVTRGTGIQITWQDGPLGRGADRKEPNGAFVEGVIAAALDRLDYYQRSRFACAENETAAAHLREALRVLEDRTADRERRAVEGTHAV